MTFRPRILPLLAALVLAGPTGRAAAAPLPPSALLLFLSASEGVRSPAAPAALRDEASRALVAAFASPGRRVCAGAAVEPILRAHRVRAATDVDAAVLAALADRCGAERALVLRLVLAPGELFLVLESIDTADGRLAQVGVVERPLESGADWRRALGDAVLELAAAADPEPLPRADARALLTLPAVTAGGAVEGPALLEACLLRRLLASGRWLLPAPSLLLGELRAAGTHPAHLGDGDRRALGEAHGGAPLLRPFLSEYVTPDRSVGFAVTDAADGAEDAPPRLGARAAQRPCYASLELVDSDSGVLRRVVEDYLPAAELRGSFGRPRNITWLTRLDSLAESLVSALDHDAAALAVAPSSGESQ
ncbi:MAG: hypothetical protein R3C71_12470 [Candidatus Krumholzibacteriia bacterium]|nr:hypothetical protein [bacterium]MCB9516909.1 hypothetical protein [Candidatus Latescibacterota bacterium]